MAIGIGKPVDGRLCRFSVRLLLDPLAERASLPVTMQMHSEKRAYTTKHGTTSTMTVANIGARPAAPVASPAPSRNHRRLKAS